MGDGLKDCPFCGGGAVVSGDMSVHCAATCEACGATVDATSVTDAVSKWNLRADLAQAPAPVRVRDFEIARLAREIGEIGRDLGWHRVYDRADAILAALEAPDARVVAELVEAAKGLKSIVEEIRGAMEHGTWRDEKGQRLKDTPEWVTLYNALAKLTPAMPGRNTTEG